MINIKNNILGFFLLGSVATISAQFTQTQKIVSEDRESRAEYGTSVDIKENFAIVGASRENIAAGAAYIYQKNNEGVWIDAQKLTAFDTREMAEFGGATKFGEDFVVVASGRGDVNGTIRAGALYIYNFKDSNDTWEYHTKLHASDFSSDAKLGMNPTSLDVDGETIVGGAPGDSGWTGAAYIFEQEAGVWTEKQKIVSPNAQSGETFGIGVALSGSTLAIGASETENRKGAVYIYRKNGTGTWEYHEQLMASDASSQAFFGNSVSIDENQLVVGAYGTDSEAGAAYIYQKDSSGSWRETQILTGAPASESAQFGWNTDIKEDNVVISAPHAYGFDPGELYFFKKNTEDVWVEEHIIRGEDTVGEDFFGWSVALYGDQLISGAPWEDHDAAGGQEIDRAGSAYIFKDDQLLGITLDGNQIASKVSIYPNPVTEKIYVELKNDPIRNIFLYTQLGSELRRNFDINNKEATCNISDLSAGIYFLKIIDLRGNVSIKKIQKF